MGANCIEKLTLNSTLQNGRPLNVNFVDLNLQNLTIPRDLLQKVYLLRCNNDYMDDCTAPGGIATDFNIWDRAFSLEEQRQWTKCQ